MFFRINTDLSVEVIKSRSKDYGVTRKPAVQDESMTPPFKKFNSSIALSNRSNVVTSTPVRGNDFHDNDFDMSVNASESVQNNESNLLFKESSVSSQEDSSAINKIKSSSVVKHPGSLQKSRKDFLVNLEANFVDTVVLGLEASLRVGVKTKVDQNIKLSPKENKSVIASVNHLIYEYVGAQRPDMDICR